MRVIQLLNGKQVVEVILEVPQQHRVQQYLFLNFIIITSIAELLQWMI